MHIGTCVILYHNTGIYDNKGDIVRSLILVLEQLLNQLLRARLV